MPDTSFKTAYGQTVKIEIATEEGQIISASITGDFYMSPPSAVAEIERALAELSPEDDEFLATAKLSAAMKKAAADCVGFSAGDIITALTKVMK